ncbi:hypothetical protein DY000_02051746 [Brassica cretica]|uniref:Uncharacterized protein n=1 Tax=Brassica cretica TaxID=69181 RepID=A0ABQ7AH84_BRACR|nr:hypothetical protein DY000_02051746 [Brassica cretica]
MARTSGSTSGTTAQTTLPGYDVMKWILNPWSWRKLEKKLMKHVKSEFMGK